MALPIEAVVRIINIEYNCNAVGARAPVSPAAPSSYIGGMGAAQRIIGIAGWKGSGKTTLVTRLLPVLTGRGFTVSTVKHAHDGFEVDRPGKDSHRHRVAGAVESVVSSAARWALVHELRGRREPTLDELIARMSPVDLLIVEGFKRLPHAKIEVHRPALGHPLLAAGDPAVIAIASDGPVENAGRPVLDLPALDLNAPEAVADFICAHCGLGAAASVDGPLARGAA